jgi:flavin reductase (DIM6/NTAB) family NADH-FMN oxidoreductase RutF
MLSIDPTTIPTPKLHHYLLGAIGPRPIAFASTIDEEGQPNLSPFSFFNVFSANPPILIFSPARNGRTNTTKNTYDNVKKVPEVVINIVNYDILHQMSLSSSPYPAGVNEFEKAGLTQLKSETIQPFRVAEAPVQFECKVNQVIELGTEGGAGNLVICEVLRIHIKEEILDAEGMIDQKKIDLVARMGGDWYCRANEASMFEVKKPITSLGIGFDNLPQDVLISSIFDKNDLAQLASVEKLPTETEVNEYKLIELSDIFVSLENDMLMLETELHKIAKTKIQQQNISEAWLTLLAFNN